MKLRENPAMKALAFIAAVAAFAATAIMGWYQLANYDALWGMGYDAGDSYTIYYLEREDEYSIQHLLDMRAMEEAGIELSLYQEQELAQLEEKLDAQRTNLRWQLRDQDRAVQAGNTAGSLPTQAPGLYFGEYVPGSGTSPPSCWTRRGSRRRSTPSTWTMRTTRCACATGTSSWSCTWSGIRRTWPEGRARKRPAPR